MKKVFDVKQFGEYDFPEEPKEFLKFITKIVSEIPEDADAPWIQLGIDRTNPPEPVLEISYRRPETYDERESRLRSEELDRKIRYKKYLDLKEEFGND